MAEPIQRLFLQATAHHQAGRLAEAEGLYRQILALDPNHAHSLHLLSIIAHTSGHRAAAIELVGRAIEIMPRQADFHVNYGMYLADENHLDEAIAEYRLALSLEETLPDAHNNLGNAIRQKGQTAEAMAHFRRALQLRPNYPEAMNNLGNLLREQGDFQQAMPLFQRALQLRPSYADSHNSLGALFERLGRLDEAITEYQRAIALRPHFADAQWNLTLAMLLRGDFEQGWPLYEARRRMASSSVARNFAQPLWDGSNLGGRRILLHNEQGLGDTIQFVRYVPLVQARGGHVIVQCQPPLYRLLKAQAGIEQVVIDGEPSPEFDVQCPLMSLPLTFRTTQQTIPAPAGYLKADAAMADYWRGQLAAYGDKKKIGLSWAGSPGHPHDRDRSFPLQVFAPLAMLTNVQFFSLQKGPAASEARNSGQVALIDRTAELHDFADTAALIANLDLVISADTAVAHLAGAMGKMTGVLIPFAPDWRWLLNRSDSPWYPTMRLFRQRARGDWRTPVQALLNDLINPR